MKKLLTILMLLLIGSVAFSQGGWTRPNSSYGTRNNRIAVDSAILIPTGCGTPTRLKAYDLKQGALYYDSCGAALYHYNPKDSSWATMAPDTLVAGAGITLTASGTKKVTIAANTANLDSLYGGKLDSVVKRGDTLWAFAAGDSTLIGTVSGGGGGTLQDVTTAGSTTTDSITLTGYALTKRLVNLAPRGLNGYGEIQVRDTFNNYTFYRHASIGHVRNGVYQQQLQFTENSNSYLNFPASGNDARYIPVSVNGTYADNTGNITISTGGNQWTGTGAIRNTDTSGSVSVNTALSQAALHVKGGIICDSTRIGNDWFYTKKVTLSSTDILNGATNGPFLAIDAPGGGKAIQVISATQYYFFNTTAYANGADFSLKHGVSFDAQITFPVLTNNSITSGAIGSINTSSGNFIENEPIYIVVSADDTDGDGTTSFYIYYRIINL